MFDLKVQLKLFQAINAGATLITPNRRLSATLHKLYQNYQINQQQKSWETPTILSVSAWIERLFYDYISQTFTHYPLLLNSIQEQFLWEKILFDAKESHHLLQIAETADIVKSAWGLLRQWCLDIEHPSFKSTEDYVALYNWVTQYTKICEENNWIDFATLADSINNKIKNGEIVPPAHLILIGFTELSPQLKKILNTCEEANSIITQMALTQAQTKCKRISLNDDENEIVTMARWAKSLWSTHSNIRIGCVIPTLDKVRDRVKQIFSEVFAIENTYTIELETCPFNISAGKSLLQYPIIHCALQLLNLHKKIISKESISYLLTSPFLGEAEIERIKRANFDSALRRANMSRIDLDTLLNTDDSKQLSLTKSCPRLAKRIHQFFSLLAESNTFMSYSEWAFFFNRLLTTLGWPGERSLNSEEYQTPFTGPA